MEKIYVENVFLIKGHGFLNLDLTIQEIYFKINKIIEILNLKKKITNDTISDFTNKLEDSMKENNIELFKIELSNKNSDAYIIKKEDNDINYFNEFINIIINDCICYPSYPNFVNIDKIYGFLKKSNLLIINENLNIGESDPSIIYQNAMLNKDEYNEVIIEYKNDEKPIKLFGNIFVQKNKNNTYLIIENEKNELKEYHKFKSNYEKVIIKLIIKSKVIDMSYMFNNCGNLLLINGLSKCKNLEIKNIDYMFNNANSLSYLPDIPNWDISSLDSASHVFYKCNILSILPDLSKWSKQGNMKNKDKPFLTLSFSEYIEFENKLKQIIEGENKIIDKKNIQFENKLNKVEEKNENSNILKNIGIPNYLIPIIQCLYNTEYLTKYFLNPSNKNIILYGPNNNNENNNRLAKIYYDLILYLNESKNINNDKTTNCLEVLKKLKLFLESNKVEDGKYFIITFMNKIHEEICEINENRIQNVNQFDFKEVFYNFRTSISESIISNLFLISIKNKRTCLNCKNNCTKYQLKGQNYIIFQINEIMEYKREITNKNYNIRIIPQNLKYDLYLNDCFDFFQKNIKENNVYCQICNKFEIVSKNSLFTLPDIFIIIFENKECFNYKLIYDIDINLNKYVQFNKDNYYSLYGLINQENINDYSAYCKNTDNNKWYKYKINSIEEYNGNITSLLPYILFYKKIK